MLIKFLASEKWQSLFGKSTGKLAGSSQPGNASCGKNNDVELLAEIMAGKTLAEAGVDTVLLDDMQKLHDQGIRTIYSLACFPIDRNPQLLKFIWEKHFTGTQYFTNINGIDLGIEDFSSPTQDQLDVISTDVLERMERGENILVHCGAGQGRTATVLTAIEMAAFKEYDVAKSIDSIHTECNAWKVETEKQKLALQAFNITLQELAIEKMLANANNSNTTSDKFSKLFATANNFGLKDKAELLFSKGAIIKNALPFANNKGKENMLKYVIEKKMMENIIECIEVGANVNIRDSSGCSIFGIAIATNNKELIEALSKSKDLDINLKDQNDKSPFIYAVESNNHELIKLFIIRGAKLEDLPQNNPEITKILKECWNESLLQGNFKIVKNLYEFMPDLAKETIKDQFLLDYAESREDKSLYVGLVTIFTLDQKEYESSIAKIHDKAKKYLNDNPEMLKELILSGAKLKDLGVLPSACLAYCSGDKLSEYLEEAIDTNNLETIKNIYNFDPNIVSKLKISFTDPINHAICKNNKILALEMCKIGFTNYKYSNNDKIANTLSLAVELNMTEQVALCLQDGANANSVGGDHSLLTKAVQKANPEIVSLLIGANFPINQADQEYGKTPLMYAVAIRNANILNQILDHAEVKIDETASGGKTALMYAVHATSPSAIKALVARKAAINQFFYGNTALNEAVIWNKPGMAEVLIKECKADPNLRNPYNQKTPLMLSSSEKMTRKLIALGADINAQDQSGNTALHIAVLKGHANLAKTLLELGADINAQNQSGNTAPQIAVLKGHANLAKTLLEFGAEIDKKKDLGKHAVSIQKKKKSSGKYNDYHGRLV